jgi:hypothetical protein
MIRRGAFQTEDDDPIPGQYDGAEAAEAWFLPVSRSVPDFN